MRPHSICHLPPPGSCVRVVYGLDGFELFAIGILIGVAEEQLLIEQQADQYGPVGPFRLAIPYSSIIRFSAGGVR